MTVEPRSGCARTPYPGGELPPDRFAPRFHMLVLDWIAGHFLEER